MTRGIFIPSAKSVHSSSILEVKRRPEATRTTYSGTEERSSTAMAENVTESAEMTIGEIARRTSVATSAIRYYEEIGLLPKPSRRSGRRRYTASTLQRLGTIERAQQAGFTLREIREYFFGFTIGTHPETRWEVLARRKLAELEAQMAKIRTMQQLLQEGSHCDCSRIEQCTVWQSGRQ